MKRFQVCRKTEFRKRTRPLAVLCFFMLTLLFFLAGVPQLHAGTSDGALPEALLRISMKPQDVYIDEPIRLTHILYTRYDTRYEGFSQDCQTPGFWSETFPLEPESIQPEVRTYQGKNYLTAVIRRQVLFAVDSGIHKIYPGTVRISYEKENEKRNGLRREIRLTAPAVSVRVKEFPKKNRPASFKGSSGSYRLKSFFTPSAAGLWKLKIVIQGSGNIRALEPPDFNLGNDWEVVRIREVTALDPDTRKVSGRKTFIYVLKPLKSGILSIGSIHWSYFDLHRKNYVRLSLPFQRIKVNRGFKRNALESRQSSERRVIYILDMSGTMFAWDFGRNRVQVGAELIRKLSGKEVGANFTLLVFGGNVMTVSENTNRFGLLASLERLEKFSVQEGSATGNALFAAWEKTKRERSAKFKIVLVTDAMPDNASNIDPVTVTEWFARNGIPVYVATLFSNEKELPILVDVQGERKVIKVEAHPDEVVFKSIAAMTGGLYQRIKSQVQTDSVVDVFTK